MNAREKLIVALDVETYDEAVNIIDALKGDVEIFKVGIAPFTAFGERLLLKISDAGKKVFLDLKFHDIPNTVKNAAKAGENPGLKSGLLAGSSANGTSPTVVWNVPDFAAKISFCRADNSAIFPDNSA